MGQYTIKRKRGKKRPGTPKPIEWEHAEAVWFMKWCRYSERNYPKLRLIYHVPNGGFRNRAVAGKLKAEGLRPNVPDYCLPVACGGYHGLYIELKPLYRDKHGERRRGYPSEGQKEYIAALQAEGYRAEVAVGWRAAADLVVAYFEGSESA